MKTVGLTGGIGAGKSAVAVLFEKNNIPVFNSDEEAKNILFKEKIKIQLINLLGEKSYKDGLPDKKYIAEKIFNNKNLLQQMNQIIHPEVQEAFLTWKAAQNTSFVVKEAAILFESGAYKHCDYVLTVTADLEKRIKRVVQRDQVSEMQVLERVKNQWQENRKIELSDYVLYNNKDFKSLQIEFKEILDELLWRTK